MIYNSVYKFLSPSNEKNLALRISFKVLYKLREFILIFFDPIVSLYLWGSLYKLPLSHELPIVLKFYPRYNQNLSRLAKLVKNKYNDLKIIDIGANIGDTVALLRNDFEYPILCIEGDKKFCRFLEMNVKNMKNVFVENRFISDENLLMNASLKTVRGSTSIIQNGKHSRISFVKLTNILENHKEFKNSKLLKIDTDGYDTKVIFGSKEFLFNTKPVIFFEYEPRHFIQNKIDGFSVFAFLEGLGYSNFIVYQQFSDYMLSSSLCNHELLQDLHCYFSVRNSGRYFDICVFTKEDEDLFKLLRNSEIDYHSNL